MEFLQFKNSPGVPFLNFQQRIWLTQRQYIEYGHILISEYSRARIKCDCMDRKDNLYPFAQPDPLFFVQSRTRNVMTNNSVKFTPKFRECVCRSANMCRSADVWASYVFLRDYYQYLDIFWSKPHAQH